MPRPTTSIKATELYFNKDDITTLLNVDTQSDTYPKDIENFITKEEQTKLRNIISGSKFDFEKQCYKKKVQFQKKKYGDIPYGRLYSDKLSIQSSWKPIRKVVFDKRVLGVDIENSQPNTLLQLVKKHSPKTDVKYLERYVIYRNEEREKLMNHYNLPQKTIKTIIISLCFGQDIKEISKKYNIEPNEFLTGFYKDTTLIKTKVCHSFPEFDVAEKVFQFRKDEGSLKKNKTIENSSIAMYLQNIEGDMMLTMYDMVKNDVQVDTVIHDEICFEINDYVENNKEDIMCKMQQAVKNKMEFDIVLQDSVYIKDRQFIDNHIEFKRQLKEEPDDIRNGRVLYEILKDKARCSNKQGKWLYDDLKGLWTCDENAFKKIVYRHSSMFVQTKTDKDGFIVEHNERDMGSMYRNIMEYFWTLVDDNEKLNSDNNRGFLLFKNGVLDCFNMEMLPFDPSYHFTKRINRDFCIEDVKEDVMKDVKEKIFDTAYTTGDGNTEKLDYFLEILSIALMEGGVDKKYLTMLGSTNSGKGVLTQFLINAFDEFISTFNTSVLMVGQNSNLEDASKWRFLTKCYDTRIMIGNEIAIQSDDTTDAFGHRKKTERPLNIDMIKTLVSGGDQIEARRMRENEITIVNKAFLLMLANDLPKTSGDSAFADRSLVINACRSSTLEDKFDEQLFFKADTNIKQWIEDVNVCNALIKLMCEIYKKVKHNRSKTPEWVKATVSEYVKCESAFQWVKDNYDLYDGNIEKDFGVIKSTKVYRVDWEKVGKYHVRADIMYNLYKDGGGTDSQTKFGKMLTDNGIFPAQRKSKGSVVLYRVGVSRMEDDVKPPNFRDYDSDSDGDDDNSKKAPYPPSTYVKPEPVKPKTPFEMAFPKGMK